MEPIQGPTIDASTPWLDARPASLRRHPDDGWQLADPWPLSSYSRACIAGVVRAMLPHGEPGAPLDADVHLEVERGVAVTMRYMQPPMAWGLLLLFWLFDAAPLWSLRGLRRLSSMAAEEASSLLARLAQGRISALHAMSTALRAAVLTSYYDRPDVHRHLDYAPEPFMAERIRLRTRLLAGAEPGPADLLQPDEATIAARTS